MKTKATWLLIEDDVDDQEIFLMALTGLTNSVDCVIAKNGLEALSILQQDEHLRPSCIFVDLNMPIMDGFEFLLQVKTIERLDKVPIIVYTTSDAARDKQQASRLGALFVTKYNSLALLQKFIRDCLSLYTKDTAEEDNYILKFEEKLKSLKNRSDYNKDNMYDPLLDSAVELMNSDLASIQLYRNDTQQLELVATRNFHPRSIDFWKTVSAQSGSVCGEALRRQKAIVVSDVETIEFLNEEIGIFRLSKIRAVHSIPIVAPNGALIGMISTHWKEQRQFTEKDTRLFERFARFTSEILCNK